MKKLLTITLIISILGGNLSTSGLYQKITQLNVPSYVDVTDQYKKLYVEMFAGKEDLLMHPITLQQVSNWNDFISFLKLFIGQALTTRYLSPQDALKRALELPNLILTHNQSLEKIGFKTTDIQRKNINLKDSAALNAFLNQQNAQPEWITETIIEPLQSMIEELRILGATERTPEAALILIARGLILNWNVLANDLEQLQKNYSAVRTKE